MKHFLTPVFFLIAVVCYAQTKPIDSLSRVLKTADSDSARIRAWNQLSIAYESYKPDSAILCLQSSLNLSKQLSEAIGAYKFEYYALSQMAYLFGLISNYPKALEYNIESLKVAEKMELPEKIAAANNNIAHVLQKANDNEKALAYFKIADSIIDRNQLRNLKDASLGNFGDVFFKLGKLDSALDFTIRAYELSKAKTQDSTDVTAVRMTGLWLSNLGNIYNKQGNLNAALKNYTESIGYSDRGNDMDIVCVGNLGLATVFEKMNNNDSALSCVNKAIAIADKNDFESRKLEAFEFLTNYYKKAKRYDSAFKYQELTISIKEIINSNERIKKSLSITIEEELRQREKRETILKEKQERNKLLQLLGLGMLIPSVFLFSIFVRRRKIKPQIIKFCGIVSLLMFFECLTLILHPIVVEISHHIVVLELLIFVCIAAIIIPTHHKIEHWLISILTAHKPQKKAAIQQE